MVKNLKKLFLFFLTCELQKPGPPIKQILYHFLVIFLLFNFFVDVTILIGFELNIPLFI